MPSVESPVEGSCIHEHNKAKSACKWSPFHAPGPFVNQSMHSPLRFQQVNERLVDAERLFGNPVQDV